ncbi:MAG TPA: hypothetical protein ENH55_23365 [Aurantimonas coralicida]|uniref:Type I secretion protein n=2 Tax=root TaxID=1 RepID=A0A9C9NF93_9HYPH|nr:hypothetical protein [Aurantimonas coralicida]HEU00145.1 hypothetical protein [Aurantimonas coralicida]
MLFHETEEIISRFLGYLSMHQPEAWTHSEFDPFSHASADIDPARDRAPDHLAQTPGLSLHLTTRHIQYGNDEFILERVTTHPVPATGVDVALHDFPPPIPDFVTPARPLPDVIVADIQGMPNFSVRYVAIDDDSLLADVRQISVLDDRDVVTMNDIVPLEFVESIARQFDAMVEAAQTGSSLPFAPRDADGYVEQLTPSAFTDPDGAGHGPDAPTGHQGYYVNGAKVDTAPDYSTFIDARAERLASDPSVTPVTDIAESGLSLSGMATEARLDTGSNLLENTAVMVNVGNLGQVSVVMGNWFETNSIRQVSIHADGRDGPPGLEHRPSEIYNIANFERLDATPGSDPGPGVGVADFPRHYQVDTIDGDIQISNFLSQVNFVMDGDRISLTSVSQSVTVTTGGNESYDAYQFMKMLDSYDLVVIGGNVYEGNFIEQINVMSDVDTIDNRLVGDGASGLSGSTGGNLMVNDAQITNIGAIGDFQALTPHMRDLVAKFAAGDTDGSADLGSDLAFLQAQGIRVLYITGDVYELNVVAQMNVLDDSDTILASDGVVADFMADAGNVDWTISTGGNAVINRAAIVDADDVAHIRFIDGEYYADSMLLQADFVAGHEGVDIFDVDTLAPEIIAFTTEDPVANDDATTMHHTFMPDSQSDGLSVMTA